MVTGNLFCWTKKKRKNIYFSTYFLLTVLQFFLILPFFSSILILCLNIIDYIIWYNLIWNVYINMSLMMMMMMIYVCLMNEHEYQVITYYNMYNDRSFFSPPINLFIHDNSGFECRIICNIDDMTYVEQILSMCVVSRDILYFILFFLVLISDSNFSYITRVFSINFLHNNIL